MNENKPEKHSSGLFFLEKIEKREKIFNNIRKDMLYLYKKFSESFE